jgi:hypothetical protein
MDKDRLDAIKYNKKRKEEKIKLPAKTIPRWTSTRGKRRRSQLLQDHMPRENDLKWTKSFITGRTWPTWRTRGLPRKYKLTGTASRARTPYAQQGVVPGRSRRQLRRRRRRDGGRGHRLRSPPWASPAGRTPTSSSPSWWTTWPGRPWPQGQRPLHGQRRSRRFKEEEAKNEQEQRLADLGRVPGRSTTSNKELADRVAVQDGLEEAINEHDSSETRRWTPPAAATAKRHPQRQHHEAPPHAFPGTSGDAASDLKPTPGGTWEPQPCLPIVRGHALQLVPRQSGDKGKSAKPPQRGTGKRQERHGHQRRRRQRRGRGRTTPWRRTRRLPPDAGEEKEKKAAN